MNNRPESAAETGESPQFPEHDRLVSETEAERSRRRRAHNRGDHSGCPPDRCEVLLARPDPLANVRAPASWRVRDAVEAIVGALGELDPADPRRVSIEVARRIAAELDSTRTSAAGVSSLAASLSWILDRMAAPEPDPIDGIELAVASKLAQSQLAAFRRVAGSN